MSKKRKNSVVQTSNNLNLSIAKLELEVSRIQGLLDQAESRLFTARNALNAIELSLNHLEDKQNGGK